MTTANTWDALMVALRELLTGKIGSVRTVAAGSLKLGGPEGMTEATLAHRAKEKERIEIELTPPVSQGFLGVMCDRWLERSDITVRLTHSADHQQLDIARHTLRAAAADDHTTIGLALTWPGNLAATYDGTATGLVSGCLAPLDGATIKEAWQKKYLQSSRTYRAILERTAPT